MSTSVSEAARFPRPIAANWTLFVLTAAYVLAFIDRQIISLLVEPMRADLQISDFQIGLLQGLAFAIFYTVMGIPIARLSDRHNRKKIIAAGIFFWSLMTVATGTAKNYTLLFLYRMGVGVGEAALSPAAFSILSDSFPPARAARAMAIYTLGTTFGAGLAYVIGGVVVEIVSTADTLRLPVLGEIAPWQAAYILVGLPGLLLVPVILALVEPQRQGKIAASEKPESDISLKYVFRFVWARWRVYGALYAGVGLLAIVGYGFMAWFPTHLIRKFSMTAGDVGLAFGGCFLAFGFVGAIGSALLAEKLFAKGRMDANIRVATMVSLGMLLPAVLAPLMPTPFLALLFACPVVLLINAHAGITTAALQLISPNEMRATVVAMMYFVSNLVGLGLGPTLVAAISDYALAAGDSLGTSLSVVGLLACPLAAGCFHFCCKHYGEAVKQVLSRQYRT